MRAYRNLIAFPALWAIFFLLGQTSCEFRQDKAISSDEAASFITAHNSGIISSGDAIRIRLVNQLDGIGVDELLPQGIIGLSPGVEGKAYLRDYNTLEFIPEEPLKHGKSYEVRVHLGKLYDDLPTGKDLFAFTVKVMEQDFEVEVYGLKAGQGDAKGMYTLSGLIRTADGTVGEPVQQMGRASLDGKEMPLDWQGSSDQQTFSFEIREIPRKIDEQTLLLTWNGKSIGVDKKLTDTVFIPALDAFTVSSLKAVPGPDQHIQLRFSDPLDQEQDLRGLFVLSNSSQANAEVDGNIVKIYPDSPLTGAQRFEVFSGVRSAEGRRLDQDYVFHISFEDLKPAVRLVSQGVILPGADETVLNFEAVNLRAVDVSVVKIYESNVPQFLQINMIDGNYQLRRVGVPVIKERIDLSSGGAVNLGSWNVYSLDLSKLFRQEPGAIYQVTLGFSQAYATFTCDDSPGLEPLGSSHFNLENEFGSWDDNNGYFSDYYYPDGYRWSERDNPCHVSYYNSDRWVRTNLLASNLGIIAKGTSGNKMLFAVTNLVTTQPVSGAVLRIYDFQLQEIGKVGTNQKGLAEVELQKKPYLAIVQSGKQSGYLRLDDGTALSLSKFDVSGLRVQKGLKGFIYGDRGVWRPGDTLFLNFILHDLAKSLPKGHPVVFELMNPRGQVAQRQVSHASTFGIYPFIAKTEPDAATGNWTVKASVGGAEFTRRVRIETVKPNRLKINLQLEEEHIRAYRGRLNGNLEANWLHGAPGRDLNARVEMTLSRKTTQFDGYQGFSFDDPSRGFMATTTTIFDGQLDNSGKALISTGITRAERAPGMMTAAFFTRVFEKGGDFSFDYQYAQYSPYTRYVGVRAPEGDEWDRLLTDTDHTVEIVTVDEAGTALAVSDLEVRIYKVDWRWWWNAEDNDLASYYGDQLHDPVYQSRLSTDEKGQASFKFSIPYPDWGRFLIRVRDPQGGHATGRVVYVDWPGFAGRSREGHAEASAMLAFSTDKETYSVGETARVTFPSSRSGRALLTIENGSGILDAGWIEPQEGQTEYSFKIKKEMCPNVYVNITLIQPHEQTVNDLPIRLYGVKPVMVEDPRTHLDPVIEMGEELRPGEKVTIRVSERSGRKMAYTLAVVDEGLLDLTRFKTPDPWTVFNGREALGVKTWDLYDYVIGAYAGELTRLFAIGGGMEEEEEPARKVNRFKPVVRFFGPRMVDKGKADLITFTMPEYVGSVRTMLVAAGEGAYGSAEQTSAVKKPLMVLATLPRVLGPDEEVMLPVNVFAMTPGMKDVTVSITTEGPFKALSAVSQNIRFPEPGDGLVQFALKTQGTTGVARVRIEARSGGETAFQEIELEVRNPNPPLLTSVTRVIEPGQEETMDLTLPGMPETNRLNLEVSKQPPVDFGSRLSYLLGYPHGCAEQIVSGAFPQLFLDRVMDLNSTQKQQVQTNVTSVINRVYQLQMENGGIRYWPGQTQANDWITSYAGHFMVSAELFGYSLPADFRDAWTGYQTRTANAWRHRVDDHRGYYYQSDLEQAYRLYTLAMAGAPQLGAMNRLREVDNISLQARWRLAAAYVLAGQPEVAKDLTDGAGHQPVAYEGFSSTYGSAMRDQAMILETLGLLGDVESALPVAMSLASQLSSNTWYSTQSTAWALVALSAFGGPEMTGGSEFGFTVTDSDQSKKHTSMKPLVRIPVDPLNRPSYTLKIRNENDFRIYAVASMEGIPVRDLGEEMNDHIRMEVKYFDMDSQEIDVKKIDQGTDFYADVRIYNPGNFGTLKDLALTQVFPSGWEIINTRLSNVTGTDEDSFADYRDYRDDRVNTYFSLAPGRSARYRVLLNAAYAGEFHLPPVSCEAMYDHAVRARKPGQKVRVVVPGNE